MDGQVIANLVVLKKLNLRVIAQKAKKVQSLYLDLPKVSLGAKRYFWK